MARNIQAAVLAAIAGVLLLVTGYTGVRGVNRFFDLLREFLGDRPLLNIAAYILAGVASLGGIAVFMGAYLIATDRVRAGGLLILLGSGAGLITLIFFLLSNLRREEFSYLFHVLPALVGVALGIAARFLAKPTPVL